ncbi:hypothetical protein K7X08_020957 [Anisodus acutangulus]|uniref:Uncharacterized protein n=1 Tax=Anisodus acutangulus TaxID=402998 RepID=A0A9Q1MTG3_9SOLA|nr:hypothetical protein K7X08_020957 [Anisodus acutangulus]
MSTAPRTTHTYDRKSFNNHRESLIEKQFMTIASKVEKLKQCYQHLLTLANEQVHRQLKELPSCSMTP